VALEDDGDDVGQDEVDLGEGEQAGGEIDRIAVGDAAQDGG
jgi:hypothetical protein